MRIGIVSPGYPPTTGGIEVVVARTARALARAGHTVEVLAAERRRDLPPVSDDDGVVVRRFRSTRSTNFPVAPGLWRHVHGYDVLHGHGYHTLAALGAAVAAPRTRFVFSPHYHGTGHSPARAALHVAYRPIGRYGFRRAATVVCVSRAEADLVRTHFPFAADRIRVVPNAVDVTAIQAAARFPGNVPVVLSVGRLERYKRVDRLIRAFALMPEPAELVIIGDGPDRDRLAELARGKDIRLLGRVSDDELHRWYRTAGVVASLSEHEAFGLTVAEAIAAGSHVVLSDIPAHREFGVDELVPADATDAEVATALTRALTGPVPPAVEIPSWDDVAAELVTLYEKARVTA
ncbi:MAG TPA: glycosyltransferase family 4 protein [Pseudonocardiaceae bacterium]|jgi:glycosyltransferase involved in cell wall biosynthesis|nr:glycosyltransferase family 4 protein [Pseudonocardiaceae bacterium]